MQRFLIVLLSIVLLFVCVDAKPRKKSIKKKCVASACCSATNIDACPLDGCNDDGKLDPLLNNREKHPDRH